MSKEEFLPQDYEAPKSGGGYMKFEKGDNRFRILSRPILGWLEWHEKKPHRYPRDQKPEQPKDAENGSFKHFWAMIVWNYKVSEVQILEIVQGSIRERIEDLAKDEDWGAPYHYDIKVVKSGEGMETKYSVNPSPKKPVSKTILQAFEEKPIGLDLLYLGLDPFKPRSAEDITPLFLSPAKDESIFLSEAQVAALDVVLDGMEMEKANLLSYFAKKQGSKDTLKSVAYLEKKYFEAAMNFAKQASKEVAYEAAF